MSGGTYSCPHQTTSPIPCPDCNPKAFAAMPARQRDTIKREADREQSEFDAKVEARAKELRAAADVEAAARAKAAKLEDAAKVKAQEPGPKSKTA